MTVLLDPDVGPPRPEAVGPTLKSGENGRVESAQPKHQNPMKTTVQRLAKFAYDLLNDLF